MKILINFSTLKKGGGQNVALNFLNAMHSCANQDDKNHLQFIVVQGSAIHQFLIKNNYKNIITTSPNPIRRIFFEIFHSRYVLKKIKPDLIYSYFGIGIYPKKYLQVTGAVDSNLYYPEVDFWKGHSSISLLKKKLIDKYRLWGLFRANGIIFENKLLEKKCHELYKVSAITTTILPSISLNFSEKEYLLPSEINGERIKRGLFLCGWHLNKNVLLIPEIAYKMRSLNIDFHFILTAPQDDSPMHNKFAELANQFGVSDMISIVGQVKKEELGSLYKQIDFVFLLSKLESFSNNIIEAWTYKRVLVIADEPWSRALCNEAALYVNRESAEEIARSMNNILSNETLRNDLIQKGIHELKTFPTVEEKYLQEINFLKTVYERNN
jgi:glycosyltransferase involved in cell wall biosynthesis